MPKKVLIALPPAMLEKVDYIAGCEHRTRSDLIREALRRYLEVFKRNQVAPLVIDEFPKAKAAAIVGQPFDGKPVLAAAR